MDEIQASIESVTDSSVDPVSVIPSTSLSPAPPSNPPSQEVEESDAVVPASDPGTPSSATLVIPSSVSASKTRSRTPKQRAPVVPNSAADFRRREANRLAAERSRSRQNEKYGSLDQASKSLIEENERLKRQIAELEGEGHSNIAMASDQEEANRTLSNSATAVSITEEQAHVEERQGKDQGTEARDQEQEQSPTSRQEQEAHSHTILAALTDITGVDFSAAADDHNENSWIQGMESLLGDHTESISNARLTELAAVATERGEGEDGNIPIPNHQDGSKDSPLGPNGLPFKIGLIPSPANNPVIALAAAINTEIERIIMEDLADTKAAISTIEKQIESLKAGIRISPEEQASSEDILALPGIVLDTDLNSISSASSKLTREISTIQGALPQLHEDLIKRRDVKSKEETKVFDLVKEIKGLDIGNDDEKKAFIAKLKSLGGFVETLLSENQDRDLSYASGSYSSPAIARRRRGRPPKGDISRTIYQSFLLKPSPPRSDPSVEHETKPKPRIPRKSRKSKLSRQLSPSQANEGVEENIRQLQASTPVPEIQPSVPAEETTDPVHEVEIELNHTDQEEATAEAVNRAEAFILSQLASHEQQQQHQSHEHEQSQNDNADGERENEREDIPQLDSTSFADFLPAQEELERQANQQLQTDDTPAHPQIQQQQQSNGNTTPASRHKSNAESALARLKKGPPGSCDICARTETTVWRKLTLGDQDLKVCNPCGLYHKKFGVIRPPELWDDGNSIRRRRTGPRSSTRPEGEDESGADERPAKRAKRGGNTKKKDDQDMMDEEGSRVELSVALMAGLSAISASAEAQQGGDEDLVHQQDQSTVLDAAQLDQSQEERQDDSLDLHHDESAEALNHNDLSSVFAI
ncbi:uncharacterized protein IL334_007257 [Kwoniella shivajii]|uniref:GATA-type domain-containing protein n=1 Tax=Kwoniella shivajii TaxID=564305 RepID=A0ABZ1D9J0_9TREE|nr:hypothetical protein IL334_007257 [Kwoniella shivajii]